MRIIKLGLEKEVDVSSIAKPELDEYNMLVTVLKLIKEKETK